MKQVKPSKEFVEETNARLREKYNKIMRKREFCELVAKKTHYKNGISLETIFRENRINYKHFEEIEKYLDIQLEIDEKLIEMTVKYYEL